VGEDYEDYPRPAGPYYERRHDWLSQGDILVDLPFGELGPQLLKASYEGIQIEPMPATATPVVHYIWQTGYGMVISNTCDFRHPKASEIEADRYHYQAPDSVYHCGFVRIAPIFPITDYPFVPNTPKVYDTLRHYDHYRKLMYLPALINERDGGRIESLPESVVALYMTDLLSVDLILRQPKITQLTRLARQQLDFKLVAFNTGMYADYNEFDPDMN
jgi:hypothetical protein